MALVRSSSVRCLLLVAMGVAALVFGCEVSKGQSPPKNTTPGATGTTQPLSSPAATTQPLSAAERKVADEKNRAAAGKPEAAFKDWGKPTAVLVLTGEQQGYLEPCGCTENQAGGLARRLDLFQQMWKKGWPTVGLDVGGDLSKDRLSRDQARLKLEFFRKASQMMKYKAWGLGIEELKRGAENILIMHSDWSVDEKYGPFVPFVSANVTLLTTRQIGTPLEYRIVEEGGIKFGVTAILGKTDPHPDNGVNRMLEFKGVDPQLIKIDDPIASLKKVVPEMKAAGAEFLILLSHAGEAESREIAKAFPEFRVILTASGPEDPLRREQKEGNALFVEPGMKGKHAACVAVYRDGKNFTTKFELVELDRDRFKNDPQATGLMREYQRSIQDERPDGMYEAALPPERAKQMFVGVDQCKGCHTKAFDVWKNSRHAHAYESLSKGRADEPKEYVVDRSFDPECLACHATGWHPQRAERFKSGFVDLKQTPHLAGQQCENCHGPGSEHVTLETAFAKDKKPSKALDAARTLMQDTRSCTDCHDHDNSPHFDYDKYWKGEGGRAKVEHHGTN